MIFGSITTGSPSLYPISSTSLFKTGSFISSEIRSYPSRHPKIASAVCNGFKQVQTFIFSTLSTVSLSVKIRPPASNAVSLPFGNSSSITRYSHSSAFTNGAAYVFFPVITGCISSPQSTARSFSTFSSGLGVILSIIVHGKLTRLLSSTYPKKSPSTSSFSCHAFAYARIASCSLSPLWEQLSILTIAIGYAPLLNRSYKRDVTFPR